MGQLNRLEALDLKGNQLTSLPESLGRLTWLQILYLSGNRLTTLPESIGQLIRLKVFPSTPTSYRPCLSPWVS